MRKRIREILDGKRKMPVSQAEKRKLTAAAFEDRKREIEFRKQEKLRNATLTDEKSPFEIDPFHRESESDYAPENLTTVRPPSTREPKGKKHYTKEEWAIRTAKLLDSLDQKQVRKSRRDPNAERITKGSRDAAMNKRLRTFLGYNKDGEFQP